MVLIQKILSGQIFPEDLNPHCDRDRELDSNFKLSHNTLVHGDALLALIVILLILVIVILYSYYTKFGCKRFKKKWFNFNLQEIWNWKKQLNFEDLTPHCDLDLEDRNPTFLHDTLGHDDAPSYQVWLHNL